MQFRKVTATKYIGECGYTLIRCKDNTFSICKGSTYVKWGSGFTSIKAAQYFINSHNYAIATSTEVPFNDSEILFIYDLYGQQLLKKDPEDALYDRWAVNNTYSIKGDRQENCKTGPFVGQDVTYIDLYRNGTPIERYYSSEPLIKRLDELVGDSLVASVILRGTELRSIFAARENRSSRDITQNLIRVKSSNVWAYGSEIKDAKASVGDVYVQFKGKNGGPGDVYKLYDVPVNVWRRWLSAPSKGHFYWKYLRNNYLYSKLTGTKKGVLPNAVN